MNRPNTVTAPRPHVVRWVTLAWVVLLIAVASGLAEVAIAVLRRAQGGINLVDPHSAWAAPLANVLLFALPSLAAVVLYVVLRRPVVWWLVLTGIIAVALFAPLSMVAGRLHPLALIVLSLGAAAVLTPWIAAHGRWVAVWSPRIALGLCAVSATATIMLSRRHTAPLPSSASALPPESPNVLLLILDTVRADALSAYGYTRATTPFLARLANHGARFTQAVAPAPWTLPSHVAMLTGQYPHHTSISWTAGLDRTHRTVAEVLASQGYRTGGFVANLEYASSAVGLDRGFQTFRDVGRGPRYVLAASNAWRWLARTYNRLRHENLLLNRRTAEEVNNDFLKWLDQGREKPFFAFINYFDAHSPYAPPPPYDRKFADREPQTRDLPFDGVPPTPEVTQQLRDAYDGAIAYIDAEIARVWAELRRRGVAERTAIIVTSDHGEEFLEHGAVGHGSSLYRASVHVPLILAYDRCIPTATVTRTVSLRDVAQTILDLTGIHSTEIPGSTLTQLWSDSAGNDNALSPAVQAVDTAANSTFNYPIAKGNMKAIDGEDSRLIVNGDATLELYRFRADPLERKQLDSNGADSSQARSLLASLRNVLTAAPPPAAGPNVRASRVAPGCTLSPER